MIHLGAWVQCWSGHVEGTAPTLLFPLGGSMKSRVVRGNSHRAEMPEANSAHPITPSGFNTAGFRLVFDYDTAISHGAVWLEDPPEASTGSWEADASSGSNACRGFRLSFDRGTA